MRVHIVCYEDVHSWIHGKFALQLQEYLLPFDISATISIEPDPQSDINHHITYYDYDGRKTTTETIMVTHIDTDCKRERLLRQLINAEMAVCMSSETVDRLAAEGLPREKLCFVNPGHDGKMLPRKNIVGITSQVQPSGCKRENILLDVVQYISPNDFEFRIMGPGWDNIVQKLEMAGFSVRYWNAFEQIEYHKLMPTLDYYLYLGMDEGSMGFMDALTAGVETIVTSQGYHLDAPGGIVHGWTELAELVRIFQGIVRKKELLRKSVEDWTWSEYARLHYSLWQYLLARKVGIPVTKTQSKALRKMAVLMPSELSYPISIDNTENEPIVTPKVPSTKEVTQVTRNGILFELDLSETIDRSLYDLGCFEPATTAAIAKLVKSGMTVIDIGANIGAHALFMAQLVGLTGRAFAIEPMSEAFRKLSRNLELNPLLANLSLHRVALGSENGSLLASFKYSWPLDGSYADVIPESVPVRCLDDFLDEQGITRVDLIKLDVAGFEHKILRGASRTLREMRPILVMELCNYTLESVGDSAATMLEEIVACRYHFFFEQDFRPATPSELLEAIPVGSSINVIAMPEKISAQATSDYWKKVNGQKPRIMLMADVPNWIFARHCQVLIQLLGNEFDFDLKFHGQSYNEDDYDLLYPLEWNLIPSSQIRTPAKYVTSIRSHTSWAGQDFLGFVNYLSCQFQRIHTVSKRLTNIFSPFVPNTAYVTHGTDTSFFISSTHADFSGAGKIRIGWAGNRVNKTKGFDELIVPLGHIPGIELVICGYMDNHLDLVEMRNFYNTIDVYVCTSHQEGNNNSLMEAAAMERAIITTDNGTVPEYLRSGYSAVIVERELPVLLRAVCTLRDDPKLRVELGRHARAAVVANFDWNVMAQKYANFFHDALQAASTWKPAIGAVEAAVAPKHAVSNVSGIDVFTLISAAERYIEEMRTDEAIGLYQTWLDNNISSPLAYAVLFNLGVCQINSGYKQKAVVNLNHALKLNPNFILAKKAIESLA